MGLKSLQLLLLCSTMALSSTGVSAEAVKFRITTENNANHVNTKLLQRFTEKINEAGQGKINAELFHSGQLYKGRDVPRALRQGSVEMAAVGTWQLGTVAPDIDLLFLPHFYGRDNHDLDALVDGEIGKKLNSSLEKSINSVVIGKWMGYGAGNSFGASKDIKDFDDFDGIKMRIPGGLANTARYQALGAIPTALPWPDTPMALQQGTIDGLLTTFETAASAKLWESGVKTAFEDEQYFGYYVPLVSKIFWDKADENIKEILITTLASIAEEGRAETIAAQEQAREILIANGVTVTKPDKEKQAEIRAKMVANEPDLVKQLGASEALYAEIKSALP